ncbi:hypothetical protein [Acidipropionibacterium thoenii]|uniref:hypothetical protein n=1 Tax=Acidipropionibacterium thoenii TaxID=1751 RepID=UPI0003F902A8|nr:hypothetical protein [Acidipropionibacterium thoenii]
MSRTNQNPPRGRRNGPVVDRMRALRARELADHEELTERGHRSGPTATVPMPPSGQEWPLILADLERRARGAGPRSQL